MLNAWVIYTNISLSHYPKIIFTFFSFQLYVIHVCICLLFLLPYVHCIRCTFQYTKETVCLLCSLCPRAKQDGARCRPNSVTRRIQYLSRYTSCSTVCTAICMLKGLEQRENSLRSYRDVMKTSSGKLV